MAKIPHYFHFLAFSLAAANQELNMINAATTANELTSKP